MADAAFVWLRDGAARRVSYRREHGTGSPEVGIDATLEAAASALRGARVTLAVPGEFVALQTVTLPPARGRDLDRAVPFACEEFLIDSPDALQFTHSARAPDGSVAVATVAQARMNAWRAAAVAAQLEVERVVADVLCLPRVADAVTVGVDGDRILVRTGAQSGFASSADVAARLLAAHCRAGSRFEVFAQAPDSLAFTAALRTAGASVRTHEVAASGLIGVLAAVGLTTDTLDLRAGAWRARHANGTRYYRAAAGVLAAALLAHLGLSTVRSYQLERETSRETARAEALFRAAFPDVKRLVNLRAQAEQALAAPAAAPASEFLPMLAQVGATVLSESALRVDQVRFQADTLDLQIAGGDLDALERVRNALMAQALTADIIAVDTRDGTQRAQLRVRGSGS